MKIHGSALTVGLILALAPFGFASTSNVAYGANPDVVFSSSVAVPNAPDPAGIEEARLNRQSIGFGRNTALRLRTERFSSVAIGTTFGTGGVGLQLATPVMTKINLRMGASMFNYSPTILEQGIPITGAVRLRSVNIGFDVYPYRNSFHITPGVTVFNGNRISAKTSIVPGSSFKINDNVYISDATDPVTGQFDVSLGGKIAPSLTLGWGNLLKRSRNWNLQTEFGVQYIGRPSFTLSLTGTVCEPNNPSNGCTAIQSDPSSLSDLQQEQASVNQGIQPLRFYPIITTILGYRFGHKTATTYWR